MEIRSDHACENFTVAVIGGGFAGTALAAQLARRLEPSFSVVVIEKTGQVGRGLAYGTGCASHLLNVPAKDMSAFADDPGHFLLWARAHYDREVEPCSFLPRMEYGRYLESIFSDAVRDSPNRRLQRKRDEAQSLSTLDSGEIEIRLRSGARVRADKVVLALGNFPSRGPFPPAGDSTNRDRSHPVHYFSDPWQDPTFEDVENLENILLLGSGLTGVDVVLRLREQGFRGTIHLLSRRGLLPQSHQAHGSWPVFWNNNSPKTALGMLRLIRGQVREAEKCGEDWRAIIDCLRKVTPDIWQSLPEAERKRFLRHARPYWEVHRHRAAPQVAKLISNQISSGKIQLHAGRVAGYWESELGVQIAYHDRKTGSEVRLRADRVINCTGPEVDCRQVANPLLRTLVVQGKVRPDPLFLGLVTSPDGALVSEDGAVSDNLFAVGPVRKAGLWESTAVPEIRAQVRNLVEYLANDLARPRPVGLDSESGVSRQITSA